MASFKLALVKRASFAFTQKGLRFVSVKGLVALSVKRAKTSTVKFEKVTKKKKLTFQESFFLMLLFHSYFSTRSFLSHKT